jgi:hypothetical protein
MYVGFVISEAADPATLLGAAPQPGEGVETADDAPAVAVEPGQWVRLGPGEDVRMSSPPGVDNSFDSFWYRVCLKLAAATGLPYAVVTGDLRQASYGSQRAGLVEFRRRMEQTQHAIFVFQLCRPVWQRWCADAVLAGAIDLPGFASRPGDFHGGQVDTAALGLDRSAEGSAGGEAGGRRRLQGPPVIARRGAPWRSRPWLSACASCWRSAPAQSCATPARPPTAPPRGSAASWPAGR